MNKKWPISIALALTLCLSLLAACGSDSSSAGTMAPSSTAATPAQPTATSGASSSSQAAAATSSAVEMNLDELAYYDGKDGRPAYVAVDGVIYNVTNAPNWENGDHESGITAGNDLTEAISRSPHGTTVLEDLPVIGTLVQ